LLAEQKEAQLGQATENYKKGKKGRGRIEWDVKEQG